MEFEITTNPDRLDVELIYRWLAEDSYWAVGIPRDIALRAIEHSINFGAYAGGRQVGFARVVTDRATFAWLADVFVVEDSRGRGCGKALVAAVLAHPELQGLRRIMLATRDAHSLYAQYGFTPIPPDRFMEIRDPNPYDAAASRT